MINSREGRLDKVKEAITVWDVVGKGLGAIVLVYCRNPPPREDLDLIWHPYPNRCI